jgi:arabinogalactan oligomer/maltooligosaccharide transport system permease protein
MTRRIALALLVAGTIGCVAIFMVAAKAQTHEYHQAQLHQALAQGAMLADLAGRTAQGGLALSQLQPTIRSLDETEDGIVAVKIVQGRRLEVSTARSDTGESAAPRRLKREEKGLFDRAALLAAAVRTNLDGLAAGSRYHCRWRSTARSTG